ncbi:MAG TPA: Asp-tRNA(Asn)/Glu-tRNA(Gln) amidotransferase subunit GatC [Rhabdochlamydiaceae bacterium]|nr:Asp-tRNA(Asn)/Glu-tRNA(Gln) amidotransferase subunit GatC [Rhabdochlamydiaceae bacterium]
MNEMNHEQIDHLAKLCRIECSKEEKERLSKNLSQILAYIEQLDKLDTENILPCSRVLETAKNGWRDDVVGDTLSREKLLENSSSHVGGMVRVPPIIKF